MGFTALSLKGRALRLLSQREHSRAELQRKLSPHVQEGEDLNAVLDGLQAKGFISEERVAESVVHRRSPRMGAARIHQELKGKGLSPDLMASTLQQLRATELQLRTQFEANLRNLSNDQTLIRAREQAVASSDEVSRATEAGYNLGMRTQLDLLQARRNALAARQQLSDARHQYVRDYLNAHAAQGSLNRTVLQDINRWFGDGKPSR